MANRKRKSGGGRRSSSRGDLKKGKMDEDEHTSDVESQEDGDVVAVETPVEKATPTKRSRRSSTSRRHESSQESQEEGEKKSSRRSRRSTCGKSADQDEDSQIQKSEKEAVSDADDSVYHSAESNKNEGENLESEMNAAENKVENLMDEMLAAENKTGNLMDEMTAAENASGNLMEEMSAAENKTGNLTEEISAAENKTGNLMDEMSAAENEKNIVVAVGEISTMDVTTEPVADEILGENKENVSCETQKVAADVSMNMIEMNDELDVTDSQLCKFNEAEEQCKKRELEEKPDQQQPDLKSGSDIIKDLMQDLQDMNRLITRARNDLNATKARLSSKWQMTF